MSTTEILEELVIIRDRLPVSHRDRFQKIINRVAFTEFFVQKLIRWYQDDNDWDYYFEGEMKRLIQYQNGTVKKLTQNNE